MAVDRDGVTVVEVTQRDAVRDAVEAELDTVVHESLGAHPRADAGFLKEIRDAVFDDAGPHAVLHVVETPRFDDDGVDTFTLVVGVRA